MAEINDNISAEDLGILEGILNPLNKNPQNSEDLNPMASVFRKKMGYAEPIAFTDEDADNEDEFSDNESPFKENSDDEGDSADLPEENEPAPPDFKSFDDDDEIDLDELLSEPSGIKDEKAEESSEDDFGTVDGDDIFSDLGGSDDKENVGEDSLDALEDTDEDPFADTGDSDSGEMLDDPFADIGGDSSKDSTSEIGVGDDPFTDLDSLGGSPEGNDESEDPFGESKIPGDDLGLDDGMPEQDFSGGLGDDPFADLGGESKTDSNADIGLDDDPFSNLGENDPTSPDLGEDPFSDMGIDSDSDLKTEDGSDEDPFADLDSLGGSPDVSEETEDPFGESSEPNEDIGLDDGLPAEDLSGGPDDDPFSDLGGNDSPAPDLGEDPFADLGVDLDEASSGDTGFEEPVSGIEPPSFDDVEHFDSPQFDDLEPPDLHDIGSDESIPGDGVLEDELSSLMEEEEGSVDEGLTDEDLAIIQREIVKYPPKLRRQVIDSIVNSRIPIKNQKELIEIIKHQQPPEEVAAYLSSILGEDVPLRDTSRAYSDDGVPIISTNPLYTKEGALRRRKLIKNTLLASVAALLFVSSFISLYKYVIVPGRASSHYEEGLEAIRLYSQENDESEKKRLLRVAKEFYIKGEEIHPHSLEYMNAYGIEYMKAGRYEDSFGMLFGKVDPPFGNWSERKDVPFISIHPDSKWDDRGMEIAGIVQDAKRSVHLTSQDRVKRKILKPGAYIVARVKEDIHHVPTYINLGVFHSFHSNDFIHGEKSKNFKNDNLAIEYFKRVFTDANEPANIEARSGIAKIYYNKKEYPRAASEYNKILEIHPKSPIGHGGLLSSYIELWKKDGNPQFVLNHHRNLKNKLGIEEDLSLYKLTKLASFYIDLNPEETRVRYNVTPEDQVTGMDIDQNAEHILSIVFGKEETRNGKLVSGNKYAEGYYQRGRLFLKKKEALRAMKQFELAASYDSTHYPAVLRMAEYYMGTFDYAEAENLLKNSEKRYLKNRDNWGRREEDETYIDGDPGRIYFNRGKILYLNASGILEADQIKEFPGRKIYPERAWVSIPDKEMERRKRGLYHASEFFRLANTEPHVLKDKERMREMIYYEGWISYMLGNFQDSMNRWNDLEEEDLYHNTTLLMGMGNASYYTKQYNSALGYYKKVAEDYEAKESMIKRVMFDDQDHQEIYQILIAVYNNIGAVLESQGDSTGALTYYWKAIESARKIEIVSEIANSNKDLIMKKARLGQDPLLEDWLSPTLDQLKTLIR